MDPHTTPDTPQAFIGCDVGKHAVVVFNSSTRTTTSIRNTRKHLGRFAQSLGPSCLAICEATGGYETALLEALGQAGIPAHRADARKVKAFLRSEGVLGTSDRIDAAGLAGYGREKHERLSRWTPTNPLLASLQAMVQTRRDLVADQTAWTNRAKAPGTAPVQREIHAILAAIARQIARIDLRIRQLIERSRPLQQAVAVLRTIKGIAQVTATTLLALLPELGTMDRRRAPSLSGLAPHPNQSGTCDGYRRVRGGRPDIKRVLFMAALTACRHDPVIAPFYQRLIEAGKKKLVALTAAMRKIIVIANARLRDAGCQLS